MKAIPYVVMAISFLPFLMVIVFVWIALADNEAEKKAKKEPLDK